jgi:hypothetical protein
MKNTILRLLISAILLALLAGIVVTIVGVLRGWKTSTQFSDGFFYAGAILISLGVLNILGGRNQPASGLQTSQSAVPLDNEARFKLWRAETLHGYNLLAFLGTSGLLLFGLSYLALLVGRP